MLRRKNKWIPDTIINTEEKSRVKLFFFFNWRWSCWKVIVLWNLWKIIWKILNLLFLSHLKLVSLHLTLYCQCNSQPTALPSHRASAGPCEWQTFTWKHSTSPNGPQTRQKTVTLMIQAGRLIPPETYITLLDYFFEIISKFPQNSSTGNFPFSESTDPVGNIQIV